MILISRDIDNIRSPTVAIIMRNKSRVPSKTCTSVTAGAVEHVDIKKTAKYEELTRTYLTVPLACEVTGVWNAEAEEFFNFL